MAPIPSYPGFLIRLQGFIFFPVPLLLFLIGIAQSKRIALPSISPCALLFSGTYLKLAFWQKESQARKSFPDCIRRTGAIRGLSIAEAFDN